MGTLFDFPLQVGIFVFDLADMGSLIIFNYEVFPILKNGILFLSNVGLIVDLLVELEDAVFCDALAGDKLLYFLLDEVVEFLGWSDNVWV